MCAEKLLGAAQEFSDGEIEDDPILRGIDKNDPIARNLAPFRTAISLPLSASQMRASEDAVTTRLPSPLNAALVKKVVALVDSRNP